MWWKVKWVILWSLWAGRFVRQPTLPVLTTSGWVRGSIAVTGTHKEYLGIPYASVVKRFQPPGPAPLWDGTFEAVDEYIRCRQLIHLQTTITTGQEDCLVLNVYSPLNSSDKPLPVMFYIHGGGFFENSGSRMIYGPEFLTPKDVILVTINYRMNIQGYICLGIKEAQGNAGMKDQVAALRWVQKNIKAFGGDPDNVTIFGDSAGGSSVSFLILSPMAKGLFHKAISMSGSSLSAWSFQYNSVYMASLLAKSFGLDSMDPNVLYKFFMTKTDTELVTNRVPRQEGNLIITEILYTPCVEKDLEGEEEFLTELPYDILTKGNYNKVPIIIGMTLQEGLLFLSKEKNEYIDNLDLGKTFPKDLVFPSNEIRKEVADKFKELYFGKEELSSKTKVNLSQMHAAAYFDYPISEEIELLLKTSDQPVYPYLFAYDGGRNILKLHRVSSDLKKEWGAIHADDIFYIFSQPFIPNLFSMRMVEKMSTMWTNFAKFGDPTPVKTELLPMPWPAATMEDQRMLFIDEVFSTIPLWHSERLKYWKTVYSKYRRKL